MRLIARTKTTRTQKHGKQLVDQLAKAITIRIAREVASTFIK